MARILDGAALAAAIKQEVAEEVGELAARGVRPGLAAVLVGHVAASEIYVRNKVQACAELGIYSDLITPPADVSTEDIARSGRRRSTRATTSTAFSSSCLCRLRSTPRGCSMPSIPPKTWTAFIP